MAIANQEPVNPSASAGPEYIDAKRVSEIIGLSEGQLIKLRLYNPENSPHFFRIGRRVLYPLNGPNGLSAWVDQRLQGGRRPRQASAA